MTDLSMDDNIAWFDTYRKKALAQASVALGDNPDEAAEAIQLEKQTGDPAKYIHTDIEKYKDETRSKLLQDFFENNSKLQDYSNSHPLAASVSNDDWGSLDALSKVLDKKPTHFFKAVADAYSSPHTASPLEAIGRKAIERFVGQVGTDESFNDWFERYGGSGYRLAPEFSEFSIGTPPTIDATPAVKELAHTAELGFMTIPGLISGAAGILSEALRRSGAPEYLPETQITGKTPLAALPEQAADFLLDPGALATLSVLFTPAAPFLIPAAITQVAMHLDRWVPWLKSGKPVPVGADHLGDHVHALEAERLAEYIEEVEKLYNKTQTGQRSPPMGETFVGIHVNDKIGIPYDTALELYQGTEPSFDDGKLGSIPGFVEGFRQAEKTGGDIEVPFSHWLAHVPKEVKKQLHEDVRYWLDGMTLREAKEVQPIELGVEARGVQVEQLLAQGEILDAHALQARERGDEGAAQRLTEQSERMKQLAQELGPESKPAKPPIEEDNVIGRQRFAEEMAKRAGKKNIEREKLLAKIEKEYEDFVANIKPLSQEERVIQNTRHMSDEEKLTSELVWGYARNLIEQLEKTPGSGRVTISEAVKYAAELALGRSLTTAERFKLRPMVVQAADLWEMPRDIVGKPALPIDTVRRAAGFGDKKEKKLSLLRSKVTATDLEMLENEAAMNGWTPHSFHIIDEKGNRVGDLGLAASPDGKHVYIGWVGGAEHIVGRMGEVSNVFGPKLVRDLLRQLKAEFPNMESISGFRSSGAREEAGTTSLVTIKANMPEAADLLADQFRHAPDPSIWLRWDKDIETLVTPFYSKNEQALIDSVNKVVQRMAPRLAEIVPALQIRGSYGGLPPIDVRGNWSFIDGRSLIMYVIDPKNSMGSARHEVFHHLWEGFFTGKEKNFLSRTAREEGWIKKHDIDKRYSEFSYRDRLVEALAEHFGKFRDRPQKFADTMVGEIFYRINQFLNAIKEAIGETFRKLAGKDPTYTDFFRKMERGEVGSRETWWERQNKSAPAKPPFEKGAGIYSAEEARKYERLIQKQEDEDVAAQYKRVEREVKKRQTAEWKQKSEELRPEVEASIKARPEMAAAEFFRQGRIKLDAEKLSEDHKKHLPKNWYGKDGYDPDVIASGFGFDHGTEMLDRLSMIENQRQSKSPKDFLKRLVDAEVKRQMESKHGSLEENIINETQDHVLGTTQMDLLHDQTLAMGLKAGIRDPVTRTGLPYTKANVLADIREDFKNYPNTTINADKFLTEAGRAERAMRNALLSQDFVEAYRQQQRQYYAGIMAKEARKFQKEKERFEKTAKRFEKQQVTGVDQDWTNFVHDILMRVGMTVDRSRENLAENIQAGGYRDILDFVVQNENNTFGMLEIPIADFLLDPTFQKSIGKMTVDEHRGVMNSVNTLVAQGRTVNSYEIHGRQIEREKLISQLIDSLQRFPIKDIPITEGKGRKLAGLPKAYIAAAINFETWANHLDINDPRGPWNKWIIRPLTADANHKERIIKDIAKAYQKVGIDKLPNLHKEIDAPFTDPRTGRKMTGFTNLNKLAMIANAGNKSNLKVLAEGYGVKPEFVLRWLEAHSTKEEWDAMQKLGDSVFAPLWRQAKGVYYNLTKATPEELRLEPITMHGKQYRGWYYPLIEDPERSTVHPSAGAYPNRDFGHAFIANGYTKRRTGATYPLDLNFDSMPYRISQMIHDIAFRESVVNAEKVLKSKRLYEAVRNHQGKAYADGMMDWLRGIAGNESINSGGMAQAARASEFLRKNTIGFLIGFNPYTVLKHGPTAAALSLKEVGPINFARAFFSMWGRDEKTGQKNRDFVDEKSEEVGRRKRHWDETIVGTHKDIFGKGTLRERVLQAGSWAVAQSDMVSTRSTWLAQYRKSMEDLASLGKFDEGQAIFEADRAVRRAHGSTAITNLPAMVRKGGPIASWMTSLFGFFGTMAQRRVEIAYQMTDAYRLGRKGEIMAATKEIPSILMNIMTYVVMPTAVEEWVTGLTTDDRRGWGTHILTAAATGMASSFLYIRDIVWPLIHGKQPDLGLVSTPLHDVEKLINDIKKGTKAFSREHAAKTVGDTLSVFGEATGMVPKVVAKGFQFGIDYGLGRAHPRTFRDWRMGVTRGQMKAPVLK